MKSKASIPGLTCPACSEVGTLHLRLEDGVVVCTSCDEEFEREAIERAALSWARLVEFLKRFPTGPEGEDEL